MHQRRHDPGVPEQPLEPRDLVEPVPSLPDPKEPFRRCREALQPEDRAWTHQTKIQRTEGEPHCSWACLVSLARAHARPAGYSPLSRATSGTEHDAANVSLATDLESSPGAGSPHGAYMYA